MKKKQLILITIILVAIVAECIFLFCIKARDRQVINSQKKMAAGIVLEPANEISTFVHRSSPDYIASSHIYSHRGIEGDIEHSFEAYDSVMNAGSRFIEQDIVMSKDGTLYVSHDLSAYSMTGVSKEYANMTDEEIDDLRTYKGKKILKLSDVFDKYERTVNYVIELKVSDDKLLRSFEEIIDKYNYEDIVIAQCEFLSPLSLLKQKYPAMPMLYICRSQKADFRRSIGTLC
ncbi:MAG: hypothetical protein IJH92_02450 [Mogibacterium sp.]|nr:hypothetical protein [Mogibacterium sp.]